MSGQNKPDRKKNEKSTYHKIKENHLIFSSSHFFKDFGGDLKISKMVITQRKRICYKNQKLCRLYNHLKGNLWKKITGL